MSMRTQSPSEFQLEADEDGRRERQREPNGRGGGEAADEGPLLVTIADKSSTTPRRRQGRRASADRAQPSFD